MTNELTVNDLLMDAPPPKREYHFGIIHVSSMFLHQVGASIRECNTQGELEDKGVFTAVHKLLLLPDSYTIRGMFLRMQDITHWHIWVESPDLPTVEEYSEPPEIVPIYRCELTADRL